MQKMCQRKKSPSEDIPVKTVMRIRKVGLTNMVNIWTKMITTRRRARNMNTEIKMNTGAVTGTTTETGGMIMIIETGEAITKDGRGTMKTETEIMTGEIEVMSAEKRNIDLNMIGISQRDEIRIEADLSLLKILKCF